MNYKDFKTICEKCSIQPNLTGKELDKTLQDTDLINKLNFLSVRLHIKNSYSAFNYLPLKLLINIMFLLISNNIPITDYAYLIGFLSRNSQYYIELLEQIINSKPQSEYYNIDILNYAQKCFLEDNRLEFIKAYIDVYKENRMTVHYNLMQDFVYGGINCSLDSTLVNNLKRKFMYNIEDVIARFQFVGNTQLNTDTLLMNPQLNPICFKYIPKENKELFNQHTSVVLPDYLPTSAVYYAYLYLKHGIPKLMKDLNNIKDKKQRMYAYVGNQILVSHLSELQNYLNNLDEQVPSTGISQQIAGTILYFLNDHYNFKITRHLVRLVTDLVRESFDVNAIYTYLNSQNTLNKVIYMLDTGSEIRQINSAINKQFKDEYYQSKDGNKVELYVLGLLCTNNGFL